MSGKTFKEKKEYFYSKAGNLSVFQGKYANYIKVALDGYSVDYASKGAFNTPLFESDFNFWINHFMKLTKTLLKGDYFNYLKHLKIAKNNHNIDLMIIDVGRQVKNEDGQSVSVYFDKIYKENKKSKSIFFASNEHINNYNYHQDIYADKGIVQGALYNSKYKKYREDIRMVYDKLELETNFSEYDLKNFRLAFQIFFNDFIYWHKIFEKLNPKEIFFICHYHNEGLILAAKQLGIRIVEFQHGLIAKSDIFYNFPSEFTEIRKDALMPDFIFTYGKYWSEILMDGNAYTLEQIKEIGFYQYSRIKLNKEELIKYDFNTNNKIITVCTQPIVRDHYIAYINSLIDHVKKLDESIQIIVKLHPADDEELYNEKVNKNNSVFIIKDMPVDVLLNIADINISVYSTTVFDALRMNTPSYLVNVKECQDYVSELSDIGDFPVLEIDQFPDFDLKVDQDINYYFENCNEFN